MHFYPRSPCGERQCLPGFCRITPEFLSTLSLRRATGRSWPKQSNHHKFLSTLSLRRATQCGRAGIGEQVEFLSTLSLRRATSSIEEVSKYVVISIHALLAESDAPPTMWSTTTYKFLSTLSLRRATVEKVPADVFYQAFLSTLSLRRATVGVAQGAIAGNISIHALLAESDGIRHINQTRSKHFYPRSPCGERLENTLRQIVDRRISIHALLAESDQSAAKSTPEEVYFYPRSPCGERLSPGFGFC